MFNYYCRLFWITSFTRRSKTIIGAIEKVPLFRKYPILVNPAAIEAMMHPVRWSRDQARRYLPARVVEALQDWREARIRKASVAEGEQVVVCR